MTDSFGPTEPSEPVGPETPEQPEQSPSGAPVQPPTETEMTAEEAPQEPTLAPKSRRRWLIPAVGAAVVAALAGGATWAAMQLMSSGDPVASALPDSTLAFVSVDLDPSASQKIEAIKFMQKLPALHDHLGFDLGVKDDLRKWIGDQIADSAGCADFDYAKSVEPWLGERFALAGAKDANGELSPFFAVQVSDQAKAKAAIADNFGCPGDAYSDGLAFVGQYAVFAETQDKADYFAKQATKSSLEDDTDYQKWMDRVDGPGIITAYASPDALTEVMDQLSSVPGALVPGQSDLMKQSLDAFTGMAAVVRFSGGDLQIDAVGNSKPSTTGYEPGVAPVADLPNTTALVIGAGYGGTFMDTYTSEMWDSMMAADPYAARDVKQFERMTGLKLPDDIATLFGTGFALTVDSSLDVGAIMESPNGPDPSTLPVGLRLTGDTDAITGVLSKLQSFLGEMGFPLAVETGDGVVGVSPSPAYASLLTKPGDLGSTDAFKSVVSGDGQLTSVGYFDFGAIHDWVQDAAAGDPSAKDVLDNLDALKSAGIAGWANGDEGHFVFRLSTS